MTEALYLSIYGDQVSSDFTDEEDAKFVKGVAIEKKRARLHQARSDAKAFQQALEDWQRSSR